MKKAVKLFLTIIHKQFEFPTVEIRVNNLRPFPFLPLTNVDWDFLGQCESISHPVKPFHTNLKGLIAPCTQVISLDFTKAHRLRMGEVTDTHRGRDLGLCLPLSPLTAHTRTMYHGFWVPVMGREPYSHIPHDHWASHRDWGVLHISLYSHHQSPSKNPDKATNDQRQPTQRMSHSSPSAGLSWGHLWQPLWHSQIPGEPTLRLLL